MAELLIRVIDKPWRTHEFYRERYYTKAGDVIACVNDGWGWGRKELASPDWRIFQLPGYPKQFFSSMFESETYAGKIIQSRIRHFNLSGSWARSLVNAGAMIRLTGKDARRFIKLSGTRDQAAEIVWRPQSLAA